jgi:hypothetical protein
MGKPKGVPVKEGEEKIQEGKNGYSRKEETEELLLKLHEKISGLPMRSDLRRLLKKSIFGLFVGLKVDNEILFLNDVRKLLEKVKETYDSYYRDLMSILEDIYLLAIDK